MGFHTYNVEELLSLFDSRGTVADLGSGTGFYTDNVAPHVELVYAVDVQERMHKQYRQRGVPENVRLVTAEASDLPFDDDSLTGAFSVMTGATTAHKSETKNHRVRTHTSRATSDAWRSRKDERADLSTTMQYIDLLDDDVKKAYKAFG